MTARIGSVPPDRKALSVHPYLTHEHVGDRKLLVGALALASLVHVLLLMIDLPKDPPPLPALQPPSEPAPEINIWHPPLPKINPLPRTRRVTPRRIPVPVPVPQNPEPLPEKPVSLAPSPIEFDFDPQDVDIARPPDRGPLVPGANGVTVPVLIERSKIKPDYPELARQARLEGDIILQAVVRADGTVGQVTVLRASPSGVGFEEAAMEAVQQWRYLPAAQNGRPVAVYFSVRVRFELN